MPQRVNYAGLWSGSLGGTNTGQFTLDINQNGNNITGNAHINEPRIGSYVYKFSQVINDPLVITLLPGSKPQNVGLGIVTVSCKIDSSGKLMGEWCSSIGTKGRFSATRIGEPSMVESNQERQSDKQCIDSVFIVHGKDDGPKHAVARFLMQLGLNPIILHEQLNMGKTVIEKFEKFSAQAQFAVILLTPDDRCVDPDNGEFKFRARQNVLYELGYFTAALGRDHTFVLKKGEIEIPSDIFGIVYEPYDEGEGWKNRLTMELKAAGYHVKQ